MLWYWLCKVACYKTTFAKTLRKCFIFSRKKCTVAISLFHRAFKHYLKIHKLITIKMNYPFPSTCTYIFNCVLWTLLHRRVKSTLTNKLPLKQCWILSINVAKEYQRWIPVDISLCAGCKNNYSNWLWNK